MDNNNDKYKTDSKFTKDIFEDPNYTKEYFKNVFHDVKNETKNTKDTLSETIEDWINKHPTEFILILSIIFGFASYEIYKHMIANAIFKANKKTLEYIFENLK